MFSLLDSSGDKNCENYQYLTRALFFLLIVICEMETPNQDVSSIPVSPEVGSLPKKCPDCPASELKEKKIRAQVEKAALRSLKKIVKLGKITRKAKKLAAAVEVFLKPSVEPHAPPSQINAANHLKKLLFYCAHVPPALVDWTRNAESVLLVD